MFYKLVLPNYGSSCQRVTINVVSSMYINRFGLRNKDFHHDENNFIYSKVIQVTVK